VFSAKRRLLLRVTLYLVVIGLLLWGAIYVGTRGFVRKWRAVFSEEFAKRQVGLTVDRLVLNPSSGLSGRGLLLYTDQDRTRPVAFLDHARLNVDIPSVLMRQPATRLLQARDGVLVIADEKGNFPEGRPILLGVQGTLKPLADAWQLEEFRAALPGVLISGQLRLVDQTDGRPPRLPEAVIRQAVEYLDVLRAEEQPARLQFALACDANGDWQGTVTLEGEQLRWQDTRFRRVQLQLELRDGWIQLRDGLVESEDGLVTGLGRLDMVSRDCQFRLQADLDAPLLAMLPDFPGLVFKPESRVQLTINGNWWLGEPVPRMATGRLVVDETGWQQEHFERGEVDFAFESGKWNLRNGRLRHGAAESRFAFRALPGDLRWWMESGEAPDLWAARLPGAWRVWFEQLPELEGQWRLAVRGDGWDPTGWKVE